jgi:hypothetical protein
MTVTNRALFDIAFLGMIFSAAVMAGDKFAMNMCLIALVIEGAGHIVKDHDGPDGLATFFQFIAAFPTVIAGFRVVSFLMA